MGGLVNAVAQGITQGIIRRMERDLHYVRAGGYLRAQADPKTCLRGLAEGLQETIDMVRALAALHGVAEGKEEVKDGQGQAETEA